MTNVRLKVLKTVYVRGVTRVMNVKAVMFCPKWQMPFSKNKPITSIKLGASGDEK